MNKKRLFLSPLALSFWIPLLVMLSYFIYRGMAPFGHSSIMTVDLGQQYIDQFAAFKRTLLSHPSSFLYSFSNGLGGDMIGEWAYYLMSPFNLLYLICPITQLPSVILLVTILKFGAAGLSMGYLLDRLKLQQGLYIPLFAINYALSGWFIANDLNLLWLDTAILLPILILQIENLFKQTTWWRYAIVLNITIISNYYIAYMIAIFITCYTIWRLTWSHQVQKRIATVRHFILGSLLGGALSAWLILPTYFQLKLGKTQYSTSWSLKFDNNPLDLLFKLLPGSFNFQQMQTGQANFYVSAFILITACLFFVSKNIQLRVKIGAALILGVLILATTWSPLTLIFHGMQYPVWYPYRFSFLLSFFLIYLGAIAWQPNQPLHATTIFFNLLIFVGIVSYTYLHSHRISFINNQSLAIFAGLFLLILAQLVLPPSKKYNWLLPLLVLVSLVANVTLTLNNFSYVTNTEYQRTIKALQPATKKIAKDSSWYRVAQTFQRTRGDSMMFDFYGGAHFSSTLSKSTATFFGNIGQPNGDNYVTYSNGSLLSDALLNMKYVITPKNNNQTKAGDPLTHLIGYRPDVANYKLKSATKSTQTWQNPYALPLGFAASTQATSVQMLYNNPLQNQSDILQGLSGQPISLISAENFQNTIAHNVNAPSTITNATLIKKDKNKAASLDLQFTPTTNDSYYLTVGSGLPIKDFDLLINGKVITQFSSYRPTVVNLTSHAKNKRQTVTIRFKQTQSLTLNNVTLYRVHQKTFEQQIKQLKTHELNITKRSERTITGTITTTKKSSLIMTTIPYAPGWHVTVDNRSVSIKKVAGYFIAVNTSPGHHTVTFKYTPPYLWFGILISGWALILISGTIFYQKKLARR